MQNILVNLILVNAYAKSSTQIILNQFKEDVFFIKMTWMSPARVANLVANSGNTAVEIIRIEG